MTTKAAIEQFLSQNTLAVVGVSRSERKFSYQVFKDLRSKVYQVFPVNPHATDIDGSPCFDSIKSLPEPVGAILILLPPAQTEKMVKEAVEAGIKHIWLQQGAESQAAIDYCTNNNIDVIHHQCILMFAEPTAFPHRVHRCIWKLLGKIPQ